MKNTIIFLLLTLFLASTVSAQVTQSTPVERVPPPDFKSDGCSSWPDGDYRECCEAHDLAYFLGGTAKERRAADKRLYKCVRDKGHKVNAVVMLLGVRLAAVRWLPTPFRWGFGRKSRKAKAAAEKAASTNGTN